MPKSKNLRTTVGLIALTVLAACSPVSMPSPSTALEPSNKWRETQVIEPTLSPPDESGRLPETNFSINSVDDFATAIIQIKSQKEAGDITTDMIVTLEMNEGIYDFSHWTPTAIQSTNHDMFNPDNDFQTQANLVLPEGVNLTLRGKGKDKTQIILASGPVGLYQAGVINTNIESLLIRREGLKNKPLVEGEVDGIRSTLLFEANRNDQNQSTFTLTDVRIEDKTPRGDNKQNEISSLVTHNIRVVNLKNSEVVDSAWDSIAIVNFDSVLIEGANLNRVNNNINKGGSAIALINPKGKPGASATFRNIETVGYSKVLGIYVPDVNLTIDGFRWKWPKLYDPNENDLGGFLLTGFDWGIDHKIKINNLIMDPPGLSVIVFDPYIWPVFSYIEITNSSFAVNEAAKLFGDYWYCLKWFDEFSVHYLNHAGSASRVVKNTKIVFRDNPDHPLTEGEIAIIENSGFTLEKIP